MDAPTILKKILAVKAQEVAERSQKVSLQSMRSQAYNSDACRGFKAALVKQLANNKAGVIAEIKKASPSKGVIRPDFHPSQLAKSYENGGATCLSVLTDISFFQGNDAYLKDVKAACFLPVLRKDFIIDSWQVYESKVLGADCILLIVAALEEHQLEDLYGITRELGMDVLIEVHNEKELALALPMKDALLGINNRNLHTFETSLQTTYSLLPHIPEQRLVITESGIASKKDVVNMFHHQVKAFLIGESFMRADNPGQQVADFFKGYL